MMLTSNQQLSLTNLLTPADPEQLLLLDMLFSWLRFVHMNHRASWNRVFLNISHLTDPTFIPHKDLPCAGNPNPRGILFRLRDALPPSQLSRLRIFLSTISTLSSTFEKRLRDALKQIQTLREQAAQKEKEQSATEGTTSP